MIHTQTHTQDVFDRIQALTEAFLTRRRRIRRQKKEKQRAKNPVLDWLEAIIWAAGWVLLINQYLLQAYQIPSGSMINTLLIGDHIFVNKFIYGPELLPGFAKLPSPVKPQRNDIIIFENPAYIGRGTAFDVAQRIIYMLTFSLVDIDRDEKGDPRVHFLIKRAAGVAGDRFVIEGGEMKVLFAGEDHWVWERDYDAARGWNHQLSRLIDQDEYPAQEALGKLEAYRSIGREPPQDLVLAVGQGWGAMQDVYAVDRARLETLRGAQPQDARYRALLARHTQGWYVPEGRLFPLGDNRDNSRDGRSFGPVRIGKVLGQGSLIYWPLWRSTADRGENSAGPGTSAFEESLGINWRAGPIR
ncbi:MAG: S26 family signal peptidase [Treponema sp.]|jgi:signal peptidase I|nr:S26 family signal peptidase [Treponema sp.]